MKREITAEGQLRHMFHGTYNAAVGLAFASESDAKDAAKVLGEAWKPGKGNAACLVAILSSDEVDAFEAKFAPKVRKCGRRGCRSDCRKGAGTIASLAHSIDYGPRFDLALQVECENPNQQNLF